MGNIDPAVPEAAGENFGPWDRSLADAAVLLQTGIGMTRVFFRHILFALLVAAFTGAVSAKSDSGPTPVPYKREARFSKRYDPTLVPDRPAFPGALARLEYPKSMKAWGQTGFATVAFLVKATGVPAEVQCIEATDRAFAKAAERAVERSIFIPALKHQQGVTTKVVHRFEFLPDGARPVAGAGTPSAAESSEEKN